VPHADSLAAGPGAALSEQTILALNKIDRVPKPKLLPLLDAFGKAFPFAALVPIFGAEGRRMRRAGEGGF